MCKMNACEILIWAILKRKKERKTHAILNKVGVHGVHGCSAEHVIDSSQHVSPCAVQ